MRRAISKSTTFALGNIENQSRKEALRNRKAKSFKNKRWNGLLGLPTKPGRKSQ